MPESDGYNYSDYPLSFEYEDLISTMKNIRNNLKKVRSGSFDTKCYTDLIAGVGSALTLCYYIGTDSKADPYDRKSAKELRVELNDILEELRGSCTCTCKLDNKTKDYTGEPKLIKKKFGDKLYYAIDRRH